VECKRPEFIPIIGLPQKPSLRRALGRGREVTHVFIWSLAQFCKAQGSDGVRQVEGGIIACSSEMAAKSVRVTHATSSAEKHLTPMRVDAARSFLANDGRFGRGFLEGIIDEVQAGLGEDFFLDAGMLVTFHPKITGELPTS
jgi:hypothetical protein